MLRLPRIFLACAVAAQASAQNNSTPATAADSAAAARSAWATGIRALRAQDTVTARREIDRAATWWPTQPTYTWARIVLAARTGDARATEAGLREYARLGLGHELTDTSFAAFRQQPWFRELDSLHLKNRSPLPRSRVFATLSDSTLWPEGVDVDPATRRAYIASVRHRNVVERGPDGRERELWPRNPANVGAVMGVRLDPRRKVLWATMSALPQMDAYQATDSGRAALLMVRISDGVIVRRWDLPTTASHVLGDVAVGPAGDVLMTDSNEPVLYRLRSERDTLERITHPLFRSLQGMAPSPNPRVVYVADYSHGLLRVDLRSRDVRRVADAPGSTSLGCDGIAWYRNSIVAVQNGVAPARVMRFYLDASGTRMTKAEVIDRNVPLADEPTIGTVVRDEYIYVANSQWEKHTAAGERIARIPLTAPVLLALPLAR